jgi:hypothetical protein
LDLCHFGGFVLGQDFGEVFIQAHLVRDPFGRRFVVTGEHHAADVQRLQGIDRLLRLGSDGVGQGHRSSQLPLNRDKHDRLSLGLQWLDALVGDADVLFAQETRANHSDLSARDPGFGALARDAFEAVDGQLRFRRRGDSLGDGMFGMRVHGGRILAQRVFVDVLNPLDVVAIVQLSRATYRKMIQNLLWATGYNTLAIPLAAGALYAWGVLLTPALGAVLMSASTVIVAINARLLKMKR